MSVRAESPRVALARCVRPATVAVVASAAVAVLYLRDPHNPGSYGLCPFHVLTGLWCPGCGGLRAAHDLVHGQVWASLSSNAFVAPLVVVLAVAWVRWLVRCLRGEGGRMIVVGPLASTVVLVALAAYTIVRNSPWGAALAPG